MDSTPPFRLMDLPREIRDHIYTFLLSEVRKVPDLFRGGITEGYVKGAPSVEIMHSSSQLSREYRKIASERMELVLAGYPQGERFRDTYPALHSSLASAVRHCTVYIHVLCGCKGTNKRRCPAVAAVPFYERKLGEFFGRLPALRSVHLKMGLWALDGGRVRWPLGPHRPDFYFSLEVLLCLPFVEDLDIIEAGYWYPRNDRELECLTNLYQHSVFRRTDTQWHLRDVCEGSGQHTLPVLGSWSRREGWLWLEQ